MILCTGEALIDMLACTSDSGLPAFAPHPGGAALNSAVALGRLGADVSLLAGVSDDAFGRMLERALAEAGVSRDLLLRSGRPTALAFVTVEDGQPAYAFHDEGTAGRMLRPGDMPVLPGEVQAVLAGGISLAGEPCGNAHEAVFMDAARAGVFTMLDPNIRPALIGEGKALRARLVRMIVRADLVKLSDEDLAWLVGGAGGIAAQADGVLGMGAGAVVVTQGASGATAFLRDGGRVVVPAPAVAVADTVGAGDTFNAGLLLGLARAGALARGALDADCLRRAMGLGVRAAAVTVGRNGANPPWPHELAPDEPTARDQRTTDANARS